jgi:hypothetical protein
MCLDLLSIQSELFNFIVLSSLSRSTWQTMRDVNNPNSSEIQHSHTIPFDVISMTMFNDNNIINSSEMSIHLSPSSNGETWICNNNFPNSSEMTWVNLWSYNKNNFWSFQTSSSTTGFVDSTHVHDEGH